MTPQRQMELVSLRTDEVKTKDLQRRKSPYKKEVSKHDCKEALQPNLKIPRKQNREKKKKKNSCIKMIWQKMIEKKVIKIKSNICRCWS